VGSTTVDAVQSRPTDVDDSNPTVYLGPRGVSGRLRPALPVADRASAWYVHPRGWRSRRAVSWGRAMRYIRVAWIHQYVDEPVMLYSELDSRRFEAREVEIFRDGSIGYASAEGSTGETALGTGPVPELDVIASEPEFDPQEITSEEFEARWRDRAIARTTAP